MNIFWKNNRALYYIFRIHSPVMVSIWPFLNICINKVYTIICELVIWKQSQLQHSNRYVIIYSIYIIGKIVYDLVIWKQSLLQHSNRHVIIYSIYIIGTIICDLVILKPSLLQHSNSRHVIIYSIYTNLLIEF